MSFGDGNLHEQIDKLKEVNGSLCAEINRQERVIEQQAEIIAYRGESIHNLVKLLDERQERIKALESLVLDWAMAPCAVCDPWDEYFACEHFDGDGCTLGIRMAELGIEVDE